MLQTKIVETWKVIENAHLTVSTPWRVKFNLHEAIGSRRHGPILHAHVQPLLKRSDEYVIMLPVPDMHTGTASLTEMQSMFYILAIINIDSVLRTEAACMESAQIVGLGNSPMCSCFLWSRCRSYPW